MKPEVTWSQWITKWEAEQNQDHCWRLVAPLGGLRRAGTLGPRVLLPPLAAWLQKDTRQKPVWPRNVPASTSCRHPRAHQPGRLEVT